VVSVFRSAHRALLTGLGADRLLWKPYLNPATGRLDEAFREDFLQLVRSRSRPQTKEGITMTAVLIVDDDEQFAQSMQRALMTTGGYEARIALNGRSAVDEIVAGGISLAIVDIMLPDFDGIEVLRRVRSRGIDIPMIAISGAIEAVALTKLDDFTATMAKPFRLTTIVEMVRSMMSDLPRAMSN